MVNVEDPRVVVWFSCGAASAVAAKLAKDKYQQVSVVYCNTSKDEHPDNERFLKDVEDWLGQKVEIISSDKYTSVDEVFMARRYMSGIKGAPCTVEMKKIPRFQYQKADDIHVFGFTVDESRRVANFVKNNPELTLDWVLINAGVTKEMCFQILGDAGISLPIMYSLGFKNNNCIGCVKATSPKYWALVRKHFPEVFEKRVKQSRELGVRLTRLKGNRVFLDELPEGDFYKYKQENVSCGPECGGQL